MIDKYEKQAVERLAPLIKDDTPLTVAELASLTHRVAQELREGKVVVIRTSRENKHDPHPKRTIPG